MRFSVSVDKKLYNTYLSYKFIMSGLPTIFESLFKQVHHLKNFIKHINYPRIYALEITQEGLKKVVGERVTSYSWNDIDCFRFVPGGVVFLKSGNFVLYTYIDSSSVDEIERLLGEYIDTGKVYSAPWMGTN